MPKIELRISRLALAAFTMASFLAGPAAAQGGGECTYIDGIRTIHEAAAEGILGYQPFEIVIDDAGFASPKLISPREPLSLIEGVGSGEVAKFRTCLKRVGLQFESRSLTRGFVVSTKYRRRDRKGMGDELLGVLRELEVGVRLLLEETKTRIDEAARAQGGTARGEAEEGGLARERETAAQLAGLLESIAGLNALVTEPSSRVALARIRRGCTSISGQCSLVLHRLVEAEPLLQGPLKRLDGLAEEADDVLLRETAFAPGGEECRPPEDGVRECTFAFVLHSDEPFRLPQWAWHRIIDSQGDGGTIAFKAAFFDAQGSSPPNGSAYLASRPEVEEPDSKSSWSVVGSLGYTLTPITDRDLTSPAVADFRPGLPYEGDTAKRFPALGRLALAQTLGWRADGQIELTFKNGDLGEEDQSGDVDVTQHRVNLYGKGGASLRLGKYPQARPASSIAINQSGEGFEFFVPRFRAFSVGRLIERESLTGTADDDDQDSESLLLRMSNLPLPAGPFRSLSAWYLRGKESRRSELERGAEKIRQELSYDHETVGIELGLGWPLYNARKLEEERRQTTDAEQRRRWLHCAEDDLRSLKELAAGGDDADAASRPLELSHDFLRALTHLHAAGLIDRPIDAFSGPWPSLLALEAPIGPSGEAAGGLWKDAIAAKVASTRGVLTGCLSMAELDAIALGARESGSASQLDLLSRLLAPGGSSTGPEVVQGVLDRLENLLPEVPEPCPEVPRSLWSLSGSLAAFRSERSGVSVQEEVIGDAEVAAEEAPLADRRPPVLDGDGAVGLLNMSFNQFRFSQPNGYPTSRPLRSLSLRLAAGSADDPSTEGEDEGYLGEGSSFRPDKLLLSRFIGSLDAAPDNDVAAPNPFQPGLANKSYWELRYTERSWTPLQHLAKAFFPKASSSDDRCRGEPAPASCYLQSQALILRASRYRLDEPAFDSRELGWEVALDFEMAAPVGVKTSVGVAWLFPGEALRPLVAGTPFTLGGSVTIVLK